MQCPAVDNTLLAEDVGIVAVRGVDDAAVKNTIAAATCGGGTVTGTLWLEDKWALANDDDVAAHGRKRSARPRSARRPCAPQHGSNSSNGSSRRRPPATSPPTSSPPSKMPSFVTFEPAGRGRPTRSRSSRGATRRCCSWSATTPSCPSKDVVMPAATAFVAAGVPLVVAEVYTARRRRTAAR